MDLKTLPSWLYSLLISIFVIGLYKISNRSNKEDKNGKYVMLFIILFTVSFIGLSYVLEKKNYLKLPSKKVKPDMKVSSKSLEVDSNMPDF